jgi:uncharacterized protein YecE (DUF72 family)
MIRVGTAGWMYKDWEGTVYPKPKPKRFNQLEYLAHYLSVVEINSFFYGPPRATAANSWLESVEHNKNFRFTAKLYQSFTHSRKPAVKDESDFKNGIEPLIAGGRFAGLLLQFPSNSTPRTEGTC